jgi:citrate synthase
MTSCPPFLTTGLSFVDGERGRLILRGVPLEACVKMPYAHAAGLLLGESGDDIARRLLALPLPDSVAAMHALSSSLGPMGKLRAVATLLHGDDHDDVAWAGRCVRAISALGPAAGSRALRDDFVALVLAGVSPDVDDESVAILGACFVVHLEHALNPSTLAVRVAASVGSSLSACFGVGLGVLEGPLHGGASTAVGSLLDRIERPNNVDEVLNGLASQRQRVPGFGHPVYRHKDPRSAILRVLCERAAAHRRHSRFLDVATTIEERMRVRSDGRLFANVDFFAATLYATLGVPLAWHTPLFFCARALGWVAHRREQQARGRVISPDAGYDGPPEDGQSGDGPTVREGPLTDR